MMKVPKALWLGLSDLYHTTYTTEKIRDMAVGVVITSIVVGVVITSIVVGVVIRIIVV